jgi:Transposase DDE domain group 1
MTTECNQCARGDMENRIKEQLMLFSDRTSTHYLRSNQLRLYCSSIAYVLLQMLRRLGLEGTELAKALCSTIPAREHLALKVLFWNFTVPGQFPVGTRLWNRDCNLC